MECSDSSDDDSRLTNGHTLNLRGGAATYQQATLVHQGVHGDVVSRTGVDRAAPLAGPNAIFESSVVVAAQSFDWSSASKRLKTFRDWSISDTEKEEFVRAGLYYTGVGDRVKCFKCSGELENWKP